MQRYRLFVPLYLVRLENVDGLASPIDPRPGIKRIRIAGNSQTSPQPAMRNWLAAKSKDVGRTAAFDSDLAIRLICDDNPHVQDCGGVANANDWWRYFRPDAEANIGVWPDNAIAARAEEGDGWKE